MRKDQRAIEGYDPVAYFTDSKPVKGSPRFTYQWHGAVWHFASAQHHDTFAKSPESYAPQYGGYCAYGVSQGHAAPVDPAAWRIINSKLYLNYNKEVQELFLKDPPQRLRRRTKTGRGSTSNGVATSCSPAP